AGHVLEGDHHLGDAVLLEQQQDMLHHRPVDNGHHRLGTAHRQWAKARSLTTGHHHRFHRPPLCAAFRVDGTRATLWSAAPAVPFAPPGVVPPHARPRAARHGSIITPCRGIAAPGVGAPGYTAMRATRADNERYARERGTMATRIEPENAVFLIL